MLLELLRCVRRITVVGTGCWLWSGSTDRDGYAMIGEKRAGRLLYEIAVGPIPEGLQLDHLCRVRCCVNPLHVEPVTPKENVLRGYGRSAQNARKTACCHGHPFDERNTYFRLTGGRMCRACTAQRMAVRRAAQRKLLDGLLAAA